MSETAEKGTDLQTEQEAGIFRVILNRPKALNALTKEMMTGITAALKKAERDATVRVVILSAEGRAFCAGADLGEVKKSYASGTPPSAGGDLRKYFNPMIRQIRAMEKPVICAVNGVAAGAGASLALACDIKICAAPVQFISAFSKVGLAPDSGFTFFAARALGASLALEHAWLAKPLSARQAEHFGLVNRVVPSEHLEKEISELAQKLLAMPARALALTKRAVNRAVSAPLEDTLEYEAQIQEILGKTADHMEGVNAFLEGRDARFKGA